MIEAIKENRRVIEHSTGHRKLVSLIILYVSITHRRGFAGPRGSLLCEREAQVSWEINVIRRQICLVAVTRF